VQRLNPRLRSLLQNRVIAAGVTLAAVTLVVIAVLVVSGGGGDDRTAVLPTPTPFAPPSPAPTTEATPEPTPVPVVPGNDPNDRIVIAGAKVNAPITLRVVPPSGGELASPDGADDVVFYDFAAFDGLGGYPGSGGKIVMSGHVDYGRGYCKNGTVPPPCQAVFWDLTDLRPGDEIELHLSNGVHRYRVTSAENIAPNEQSKWDRVWAAGEGETIALITCGGDFNRSTREYSSRHVVYGERIPG
jgi:LPXTG-site transpeptidase (sortase) family protein